MEPEPGQVPPSRAYGVAFSKQAFFGYGAVSRHFLPFIFPLLHNISCLVQSLNYGVSVQVYCSNASFRMVQYRTAYPEFNSIPIAAYDNVRGSGTAPGDILLPEGLHCAWLRLAANTGKEEMSGLAPSARSFIVDAIRLLPLSCQPATYTDTKQTGLVHHRG